MAVYSYRVIDKIGKEKKGTMEAPSREQVIKLLKESEMLPIDVTEQGALDKEIKISFNSKVKLRDLSIFCRQFGSILGAGVSVLLALDMLAEQTENKLLKAAIRDVHILVEKGESLAGSMSKHSKIFQPILINMVEAGEASGNLEIAFNRMATHFEKEAKLRQTIKKATTYPMVVAIISIIVVAVLITVVIPSFVGMFDTLGMELPAVTKALISISNFTTKRWYIVVGLAISIIVGLIYFRRTDYGKKLFSTIGLSLPLFGKLTVKVAASRFSRTLSTLLASGISLLDALEIVAKVVNNYVITYGILDAREQVSRGIPLSKPIRDMQIFPPLVVHMLKIGEETGSLESALNKVADFYDDEVESAVVQLTTLLEPAIIIVLALVVGFVIISIITPMFQMYEGIGSY